MSEAGPRSWIPIAIRSSVFNDHPIVHYDCDLSYPKHYGHPIDRYDCDLSYPQNWKENLIAL